MIPQQSLRLPFFFIDCGIIALVAFQASGLKAADEKRNLEEKRAYAKKMEAEKRAIAGQKAAQRAETQQQKANERANATAHNKQNNGPIQQPDKAKKIK